MSIRSPFTVRRSRGRPAPDVFLHEFEIIEMICSPRRYAPAPIRPLTFVETEFARTDKEENKHDAEHFDRARILLEIVRVPSKSRNEGNQHRQCDQGGRRSEKETDNDQDSAGKLGQR